LLVRFNVDVLVIVDPRRDEHSLEPGRLIADDPISEGSRINVTLAHPLEANTHPRHEPRLLAAAQGWLVLARIVERLEASSRDAV